MNAEKYPVIYLGAEAVAVLENAFNIKAIREVNADNTLDFDIYFTDPKRQLIKNHEFVKADGDLYRIKTITDKKEHDSPKTTHVYAENIFYDLARAAQTPGTVFDHAQATTAMTYALQNTDWSVGEVRITAAKSFETQDTNPLELLELISDVYSAELVFHSLTKTVDLMKHQGKDNGLIFHFRKNLKSLERVIDTSNLITRLYAKGKDGLTFASINGGKPYLENFSYTNEVLIGTLDLSNFTSASDMLTFTKMRVADTGQPNYSYKLSVLYLENVNGYEVESYGLGDYVHVQDEELGITNLKTRIVRMEKDILEPWNTSVELSTTIGTLSLEDQTAAQQAIDSVIKSFVAPRLLNASINRSTGEIDAMYETGVTTKYKFTETDNGITFTHPDGVECEIQII